MRFSKVQGLGNDFVLLDLRAGGDPLPSSRAVALCDRHRGIGADGVLTLLPARQGGSARLLIQNADGSVPEMCGNGARCAALFLYRERPSGQLLLETDAGMRACRVEPGLSADSRLSPGEVEIQMGVPRLGAPRTIPLGEALTLKATPVSMGNPHLVLHFPPAIPQGGPQALAELLRAHGPGLCSANNANIEFSRPQGEGCYEVWVWERGAGLTQACGTGACAVAATAYAQGAVARNQAVRVNLPGGALTITCDPVSDELRMRGEAAIVFEGEF